MQLRNCVPLNKLVYFLHKLGLLRYFLSLTDIVENSFTHTTSAQVAPIESPNVLGELELGCSLARLIFEVYLPQLYERSIFRWVVMCQILGLCDDGKATRMSLEVDRLPCPAPGHLASNVPGLAQQC